MKVLFLLIALVLLVSAIAILFIEKDRSAIGFGMGMCVFAGYLFRMVTDDEI